MSGYFCMHDGLVGDGLASRAAGVLLGVLSQASSCESAFPPPLLPVQGKRAELDALQQLVGQLEGEVAERLEAELQLEAKFELMKEECRQVGLGFLRQGGGGTALGQCAAPSAAEGPRQCCSALPGAAPNWSGFCFFGSAACGLSAGRLLHHSHAQARTTSRLVGHPASPATFLPPPLPGNASSPFFYTHAGRPNQSPGLPAGSREPAAIHCPRRRTGSCRRDAARSARARGGRAGGCGGWRSRACGS